MRVHGSEAACALLVMDELSNDVIVGLKWLRATRLAIQPDVLYDLLNGQPASSQTVTRQSPVTSQSVTSESPVTDVTLMDGMPFRADTPVRLSAALVHAMAAEAASGGVESLSAASLDVSSVSNSQLRQVLLRYQRVFTDVLPVKTAEQIAQARQFSIVLVGDTVKPVKQRERRLSPAEIAAATQWVREEVAAGRMEPSSGEWAAQLVIVPKHSETGEVTGWRICGDYRNLNAVTKAEAGELPLMQTVFDHLAGMQYFSKLDLLKGFHQIPVDKKSRELMAVSQHASGTVPADGDAVRCEERAGLVPARDEASAEREAEQGSVRVYRRHHRLQPHGGRTHRSGRLGAVAAGEDRVLCQPEKV